MIELKGRKLQFYCLKKWFLKILPNLQKISEMVEFKQKFGNDIKSLGIEQALYEVERLFKEEKLLVIALNKDNYMIFGIFENNLIFFSNVINGKESLEG